MIIAFSLWLQCRCYSHLWLSLFYSFIEFFFWPTLRHLWRSAWIVCFTAVCQPLHATKICDTNHIRNRSYVLYCFEAHIRCNGSWKTNCHGKAIGLKELIHGNILYFYIYCVRCDTTLWHWVAFSYPLELAGEHRCTTHLHFACR